MGVKDPKSAHRDHFTQIPNVVFEKGLSPSEFLLYAYYKRVAGDTGECWQGVKTIEEATGLGKTTIYKDKDELVKKGLIRVTKPPSEPGKLLSDVVTIVDIWQENHLRSAQPKKGSSTVTKKWSRPRPKNGHQEDPCEEDPSTCDADASRENPVFSLQGEEKDKSEEPSMEEPEPLLTAGQLTEQAVAPSPLNGAAPSPSALKWFRPDVRPWVEYVCEEWHLAIPDAPSGKALWARGAHELVDACGEFGLDCLKAYRREYEELTAKRREQPFMVTCPKSLVKVCAGQAARMRSPADNRPGATEVPDLIPSCDGGEKRNWHRDNSTRWNI